MKQHKIVLILAISIGLVLLTGCWDSVEINKRAFILGVALDRAQNSNDLNVTYEIALPEKMVKSGGGDEGKGGGGGGANWNISKSSTRVLPTSQTLHENIDRVMDFEHMQLLVIGGEEAKKGIINDMDFFFRRPQMRRRTNVVYADGKGSDLFEITPKTTKSPSIFVSDILTTNTKYADTIVKPVDLGQIVQNIRDGFDFAIVRISLINKQVQIDGAAAFREGKYVTNIEQGDVKVLDWASGKLNRGVVEIADPASPTQKVDYEIYGGNSKLNPVFTGDKVSFDFELNVEGDIGEKENMNFMGILKTEYIRAAEEAIQNRIKSDIIQFYDKYERQENVDVMMLKRKIKNYNIKFYDKNKEKLNDIIAVSDINVKVTAKIRRVGLVK